MASTSRRFAALTLISRVALALCLVLAVAGAVDAAGGQEMAVSARQPDIVVVMVDDLGQVGPRILDRLPHIRSLFLQHGLSFDAAFDEQPLCCPGRASFLTGQHVRHHGVIYNDARLLDPSHTIATALHDSGYRTGLVGKYLNKADLLEDTTPPGWDEVDMLINGIASSNWIINGTSETLGYRDRAVSDLSLRFVEEAPADQPLFLWTTPRAPHWGSSQDKPWIPAIEPKYVGDSRCTGIEPWKPPSYSYLKRPDGFPLDQICRSLLTVDDEVGLLEDAFAQRGTQPIWVFTSDNGMAWGAHGFPLKNNPWSTAVPLYFAGPGVSAGDVGSLISNIDVGPTLAQLGGTSMPWADGTSFAGLLGGTGSIRDTMIEDEPYSGYTGGPWRGKWHAIRTLRWHYVRIKSDAPILFDLSTDPWEMNPVSGHNRIRQQLEAYWPYGTF